MRMTHTGLPNAAQCAGHAKGWAYYLGRLGVAAAGGDPGVDRGPAGHAEADCVQCEPYAGPKIPVWQRQSRLPLSKNRRQC